MRDQPATDVSDEIPTDVARLRNAIACELYAQLAMRGETIDLADIPGVAYAVAAQLGHAFRVEWAPCWAGEPQDDASLSLDGAVFRASALPGAGEPGPADRYPIFDHGWPSHP
jgi:hypothetical protein